MQSITCTKQYQQQSETNQNTLLFIFENCAFLLFSTYSDINIKKLQ